MSDPAAPQLVVLSGPHRGTTIVLSHPFPVVFGRKTGMALPEPSLEDIHCQVFHAGGRWFLQDFGTREGTWMGDERVDGVRPFEPGRSFRIGTTHIGLVEGDKDPHKETEPTLMAELVEPIDVARERVLSKDTDVQPVEVPSTDAEMPAATPLDLADALPVAKPSDLATSLEAYATLGEYDLLELIGAGEVGQVWKAYDRKRKRVVALKVLSPQNAKDRPTVARFLRGAKAGGRLKHPNLVSVLAAGHASGHVYLTMEYVEGLDLERECAARGGRLHPRAAVAIMAKIADALVYAHSRGVVHRNVAPGNILVGPGEQPKLADLTLAKRLGGKGGDITTSDDVLVRSVYSPPEAIFDAQKIDERTDVYGCGATLFRAVTGRPPYRDTSPAELVQGRHVDPATIAPHLSGPLCSFLRRCLKAKPDGRFISMAAFQEALGNLPESSRD